MSPAAKSTFNCPFYMRHYLKHFNTVLPPWSRDLVAVLVAHEAHNAESARPDDLMQKRERNHVIVYATRFLAYLSDVLRI